VKRTYLETKSASVQVFELVSELGDLGELPDWRSAPAPEQPLFQTAAGRPVQVSASAMARAHALLGE
jgi:hypothetical protein